MLFVLDGPSADPEVDDVEPCIPDATLSSVEPTLDPYPCVRRPFDCCCITNIPEPTESVFGKDFEVDGVGENESEADGEWPLEAGLLCRFRIELDFDKDLWWDRERECEWDSWVAMDEDRFDFSERLGDAEATELLALVDGCLLSILEGGGGT